MSWFAEKISLLGGTFWTQMVGVINVQFCRIEISLQRRIFRTQITWDLYVLLCTDNCFLQSWTFRTLIFGFLNGGLNLFTSEFHLYLGSILRPLVLFRINCWPMCSLERRELIEGWKIWDWTIFDGFKARNMQYSPRVSRMIPSWRIIVSHVTD